MTAGIRDIGSLVKVDRASANTAVTAGGAGDATLVTGIIIDRAAIGWPESAVFAVPFTATLGAAATLSINPVVQEGNASNLADAASLAAPGAQVLATGAGTIAGTYELNVSLRGAGRYVRFNYTPDLSAASADTAALSAVMVSGGANRVPQ